MASKSCLTTTFRGKNEKIENCGIRFIAKGTGRMLVLPTLTGRFCHVPRIKGQIRPTVPPTSRLEGANWPILCNLSRGKRDGAIIYYSIPKPPKTAYAVTTRGGSEGKKIDGPTRATRDDIGGPRFQDEYHRPIN